MAEKALQTANEGKRLLDIAAEVSFIFGAPKVKKDRDREVITARFGLSGTKPKTLEEIGKNFGITRERVRQIEKNTMNKFIAFMGSDLRGQEIASVLIGTIKRNGNAINENELQDTILGEGATTLAKNRLNFTLACCKEIECHSDSNIVKKSYCVAPLKNTVIDKIIKEATVILKAESKPVEEGTLVRKIRETIKDVEPRMIVAAIGISKTILKTDTGHLGLSHWRDINPRSIKDKTYYILRKHKKPLHYTEIAKHIQNFDGKEKAVTRQAVHNELIRDERFVLIGRGIYALSEWGYTSGVVEDVIEAVLIEAGRPMHKDDIIEEVLKRRIVKETTILLNLQKGRFKRIARATYTVANGRE